VRSFLIKKTTAQPRVELLYDAGRVIARCVTLAAVAGAGSLLLWQSRVWIRPDEGSLLAVVADSTRWPQALAADTQDEPGDPSLAVAAGSGDMELATRLIESGTDVAAACELEMTPLAMAAMNGHVEMIRLLIDAGADVNQPGRRGTTALHLAASQCAAAKLLIHLGADVNRRDCEGCTPLMRFAYVGEGDPAFKMLLVAAGTDLRLRNNEGQTADEITEAQGQCGLAPLPR
jgi:hypothetical protein